jgi:ABC-type nickel/cobalt efflux system permease component RcnA
MEAFPWSIAGVGFVLGLRHALDPDHVVAVSTIVSERAGLRRSSLVGALWGLGHALSLGVAGGLIMVLKLSVSERVAAALEAVVAAMLIGLGALALRRALGYRVHAHRHAHGGNAHVHVHAHAPGRLETHVHPHGLAGGLKPFVVGMVHGLAGSAALALLALAAAPSLLAGLGYVAMLGAGSVVGMLTLSVLMALPLTLLEARYAAFQRWVQLAAGASSLLLGVWLLARHALVLAG